MTETDVLAKIVAHKREELVAVREASIRENWETRAHDAEHRPDFVQALREAQGMAVIAEIKKASPSAGVIRPNFDPVEIARSYEKGGANCLSVLTDEHFFQGHIDYLSAVAKAVSLPLLRKDFILEPCQVFQAKLAGASAILLIAECLSPAQMNELVALADSLKLATLVELYDPENLSPVVDTGTRLIGINNRNLRTFVTDLSHTLDLLSQIPEDRLLVSESGIRTPEDVKRLADAGVPAILVGEAFMRVDDPGAELQRLVRGSSS